MHFISYFITKIGIDNFHLFTAYWDKFTFLAIIEQSDNVLSLLKEISKRIQKYAKFWKSFWLFEPKISNSFDYKFVKLHNFFENVIHILFILSILSTWHKNLPKFYYANTRSQSIQTYKRRITLRLVTILLLSN